MAWQPPIPAGALWSKPVRELGHAQALLAYCYDMVQRDGTLLLSLKNAAEDMEEPYPNVKRWWTALKPGPWFASVESKGNKGYLITFKPGWIDWRMLSARRQAPAPNEEGFRDNLGTTEGSLSVPQSLQEQPRDDSRIIEGSLSVPQPNAIEVLHDDHETTPPSPPLQVDAHARALMMVMVDCGITNLDRAKAIAQANPGLDTDTLRMSILNLATNGWSIPWILKRLDELPPEPGAPYPPQAPNSSAGAATRTAAAGAGRRFTRETLQRQQRRNGHG